MDAIQKQVQTSRAMTYAGEVEQSERPELVSGSSAMFRTVQKEDVIITPAEASRRGWVTPEKLGLSLSGPEGTEKLMALLKELSRIYDRGGRSRIDVLDLIHLELPEGGYLRVTLTDAPAESIRHLGEFWEVLADKVRKGPQTEGRLDLREVDDACPLVKRLKEGA